MSETKEKPKRVVFEEGARVVYILTGKKGEVVEHGTTQYESGCSHGVVFDDGCSDWLDPGNLRLA